MKTYDYKKEFQGWIDSPALNQDEWNELNSLDEKEKKNRFYAPLEFGTAGLRGTMKTGLHNMNIHIIRHATQSFADVICAEGEEAKKMGIAIAHDCRLNGVEFSKEAACVMAANGIKVYWFDDLRPTPELSFAVIYYRCTAGLNITASHNPKEYNGYKVYWSDGAQLPPQKASAIAQRMEDNDIFNSYKTCDFDEAVNSGIISVIGSETDEEFINRVLGQSIDKEIVREMSEKLKVVYTPFHGCGYKLVPEVLNRIGLKYLYPVKEQMIIDGNFPTVESPNPENPEGFYLAVDLAKKVDSDLIIGTDPDSDRIGVMARVPKTNEYFVISGNQLGVLLFDYIISAKCATNTMPQNPGALCSIVSTKMFRTIAEKNNVHFEDTFTGFKFMAEKVAEWENNNSYKYIFAFEESFGYMMGDYVRDKDSVTASMMVVEMAAYYLKKNMNLLEALDELYKKYGWFEEKTLNLVMPGLDGLEKMKSLMTHLRENAPSRIGNTDVARVRDYLDGTVKVPGLGKVDKTHIVGSNVLYFELADDSSFIIRPSGTEPKIKVYILVSGSDKSACDEKIKSYVDYAETLGK